MKYLVTVLLLALCISCQSFKGPKDVIVPLDYTDSDVVDTEIKRIESMYKDEPVRALWRAELLNQDTVIENAIENLYSALETAVADKNYSLVKKYLLSLETAGWKNPNNFNLKNELHLDDVPGLKGNNLKAPKNIADCMDGTVTVWLDRGLKVLNGAGYADIVLGSGFFIDDRGYLITNYHVIESMVDSKYEGFARLYIKLLEDQDTKIPAKVVGYDPILDLALLKVEITPKVVFNLGNGSSLKIGDKVSAIGTPIGLEGTITSGIVSSTDRKLMTIGNVYQIDAAVNSGNSGGPLIDENYEVQAVVFAGMLQFQGLNFAIPIEYLKQELYQLYNNDMVVHPWIGAYGHTKRSGNKKTGLEVQYVMPGGSAFISGLKPGDVITEINGEKITSLEDYHYILLGHENETLLKCKYIDCDENEKEIYIYLEQRPEDPAVKILNSDFYNNSFIPLFGLGLTNSSTLNKNSYTINTIIKGSVAEELNLSVNDPLTVNEIKLDKTNKIVYAQISTKRSKNGFLSIVIGLSSSYDCPYYL